MRLELYLNPTRTSSLQLVLITVRGKAYCTQPKEFTRNIHAPLVSPHSGANRYPAHGERSDRQMD